jgi:hypothetical protein
MMIEQQQKGYINNESIMSKYSFVLPLILILASGLFLTIIVIGIKFLYNWIKNRNFPDKDS